MEGSMRICLVTVLALLAPAAQDGGKLDWKGKTGDIKAAMADAKRDNRPMLLFFTSAG
jgi:hypothetical protein